MATRDEIYAAIRNADAAGDSESVQKLGAYLQTMGAPETPAPAAPAQPRSYLDKVKANITGSLAAVPDAAKNLTLGAVRGAGSLGNAGRAVVDQVGNLTSGRGLNLDDWRQRGKDMTDALESFGADPNSLAFKTGKLGGEVAGTAGIGSALSLGARGLGAAPEVINALRTGGFAVGPSRLTAAGNLALRTGAGAATGGATVGAVDPEHADVGTAIGAAIPGASKLAGAGGRWLGGLSRDAAERLMQSALKPTIAQLKSGEAATAVQTLLKYGINATEGGVNKLRGLVSDINDQVTNAIGSSNATVSPQKVVNALSSTKQRFGNQVAPTADLNAIGNVESDFLNNAGAGDIPVQLAQKLKQGTYSTLRDKYGQLGTAETEAQKGLARGLKDEIAAAVPEVGPLNAEESRLLSTLSVTERRALMDANKNPMGLAALAHNPIGWAAFMADKSAAFKSLAARALNTASQGLPSNVNALAAPLAYRAIPSTARTGLQVGQGPSP